jgi:hypothetical protein
VNISWRSFFVLLFFYRCGMSVVGETIIARLTTLGDSSQYQAGGFSFSEFVVSFSLSDIFDIGRVYSTLLTEMVGAVFSLLFFGDPILIDIGFQSIAFVGIFKLLMAVDGWNRKCLALLMLTPSFNLWSSIASKEALLVFFVGVVSAYFVKLYENRGRIGFLEILGAVGIYIFKVHYLPTLVVIYFYIVAGRYVRQKVALVVTTGVASLGLLYLARDKVDHLAFGIAPHFLGYGSSREAFWVEKYDVFYKAPYGMLQGFFGPTLAESTTGIIQMVSFLESAVIVATLLFLFFRNVATLPVYSFFFGVFALGWLLFASYPLGIMNAGAAVRYRTGHLLLVFVIFAVIFSRSHFIRWQRSNTALRAAHRPSMTESAEIMRSG